jgi:hypothetical protein
MAPYPIPLVLLDICSRLLAETVEKYSHSKMFYKVRVVRRGKAIFLLGETIFQRDSSPNSRAKNMGKNTRKSKDY